VHMSQKVAQSFSAVRLALKESVIPPPFADIQC
jgi:hypothetical protein